MTAGPLLVAEFTIPGEPASKARARVVTPKGGGKAHAFTPRRTKDAEARVGLAFRQAQGRLPLRPTDGGVTFRVESEFHNGTRQRRDVDNMTKLILDGLNGIAWMDDTQVTEIESRKFYVTKAEARTVVRVFEVGRADPPTAKCIRCSKEFRTYESWASNPKGKKYCSPNCAYTHRVEQRKRTCANCGTGFLAHGKEANPKFCTRKCQSEASRVQLDCDHCGVTFTKQRCHVRQKNYCSPDCVTEAARNRRAERATTRKPGTCQVCGAGTTRKEYRRCIACVRAGMTPSGAPREAI